MTKLTTLRSQLASLRRARSVVRSLTAWSAAGIAVLWALAAVFLIDFLFELEVPQRIAVLLIALGSIGWAAWRFTLPLVGVSETDEDIALMVERQQEIDSDLVAALQFESPEASSWGSVQLESAVIEYVANVGSGLDVFEGFNRDQMVRRGTVFGVTAVAMLLLALIFPSYARAFFNRLFLGGMHYPTATQIDQIFVNQVLVLERAQHGFAPNDVKCAQGRPIEFLIQCSGELPEGGVARLVSQGDSGVKTEVELRSITLEQRLERLRTAQKKLEEAIRRSESAIHPDWISETSALVQFDAPHIAAELAGAETPEGLAQVEQELKSVVQSWPGNRAELGVYAGKLPRLMDAVAYKLFLGDAWTDSATIAMTPLPAIELRLTATPPEYARALGDVEETSQRQLSVLEGSQVQVAIECTNKKPLTAAWLVLKRNDQSQRFDLIQLDEDGLRWGMPEENGSPFQHVTQELRYEIQVKDIDQLSLETPIRGAIRIKTDRPPTGNAEIVHRVVLPTAQPVVHYRATDDFGIARLNLIAEIERPAPESGDVGPDESSSSSSSASITTSATESTAAERRVFPLLGGPPLLSSSLPLQSTYAVGLSDLNLSKGDRVKLTLEVVDHRGLDADGKPRGESYLSDPLFLEISDESGVLAAISEADERSEQRLTDIIKRQLGIGEAP